MTEEELKEKRAQGEPVLSLLATLAPLALVGVIVVGLVTGNKPLFYIGLIFLGAIFVGLVVFALVAGLSFPIRVIRNWSSYSLFEKIVLSTFAAIVGLIVLGLIGAAVALVVMGTLDGVLGK